MAVKRQSFVSSRAATSTTSDPFDQIECLAGFCATKNSSRSADLVTTPQSLALGKVDVPGVRPCWMGRSDFSLPACESPLQCEPVQEFLTADFCS